jgi:hypothetical protein
MEISKQQNKAISSSQHILHRVEVETFTQIHIVQKMHGFHLQTCRKYALGPR